jgi:hypothetical protein
MQSWVLQFVLAGLRDTDSQKTHKITSSLIKKSQEARSTPAHVFRPFNLPKKNIGASFIMLLLHSTGSLPNEGSPEVKI